MSGPLAVQAGLTFWSLRKPILLMAGVVLLMPLALIGVISAVFAPLAGSGGDLSDPLPAAVLTQPFGCTALDREPLSVTCVSHHFHSGIDLAAPVGSTVLAASSGVAKVGSDRSGYGIFIVVRRDGEVSTLYGHLSLVLVESGDVVAAHEVIGQVGSTGNSAGPHLHFEVRLRGQPVDPLSMLKRRPTAGGDVSPFP